jgi:hypothetical protein
VRPQFVGGKAIVDDLRIVDVRKPFLEVHAMNARTCERRSARPSEAAAIGRCSGGTTDSISLLSKEGNLAVDKLLSPTRDGSGRFTK